MSLTKKSTININLFEFVAEMELAISKMINQSLENQNDLSFEQTEFWIQRAEHHLNNTNHYARIGQEFLKAQTLTETTNLIIPLKQDTFH